LDSLIGNTVEELGPIVDKGDSADKGGIEVKTIVVKTLNLKVEYVFQLKAYVNT